MSNIPVPIKKNSQSEQGQIHQIISMPRIKEIAEFIFWLSSDKASFINGSYHTIDGGYLAEYFFFKF